MVCPMKRRRHPGRWALCAGKDLPFRRAGPSVPFAVPSAPDYEVAALT